MKMIVIATMILAAPFAMAGNGTVGSFSAVSKQIIGSAGQANQLMDIQKTGLQLVKSARGYPQINLSLSGTVAANSNQVSQIVATASITGQSVGAQNIVQTDVRVEFAGLQDIAANTVTIYDGPTTLQAYPRNINTQLQVEMGPSHQDIFGKPTAARVYNFHFPSVMGAETLITVTYDPAHGTIQ